MNIKELAFIYNSIPFSICVLDKESNIIFTNKSFQDHLNCEYNNVVNKHVANMFPIFKQPYFELRLKQVLEQQLPLFLSSGLHGPVIANCFSQEAAYFEVSVAPLSDPDDNNIYAVITIEEVTEMVKQIKHQKKLLKTLNMQLEEAEAAREKINLAQEELEISNRAKDKLLSIIGHDLKTPFNALTGISELLLKSAKKKNPKDLQRLYEAIWLASTQGTELVTNLLNWAQTQSKNIMPFPIHFNIVKLIQELEAFFKLSFTKKSIQFKLKVNTYSESVFADMDMIKVIIQNLISNAIKFSHTGSKIEIELHSTENNRTNISVRDFGVGMSPELLNCIRSNDNIVAGIGTDMEHGTGIGLSICRDFLRINHSKLRVKSMLDIGSEFYFTLPVSKDSLANTKEENQS